jgi:hypothetical protein
MHHSPQAIKRYVSTFLRIVVLHRQGSPIEEIAFLTRASERLVKDYLAVYEAVLAHPHRWEKLEEELGRVSARRDGFVRQKSPFEEGKKGEVEK